MIGMEQGEVLAKVLRQILADFAYLDCVPGSVGAAEWDLSCHAPLPDEAGWLVLRGTHGLSNRIAEASTGGMDGAEGGDAFRELCNLALSHWALQAPRARQSGWKPFFPSDGLPQGRPTVGVLLDVEGQPMEASLWEPL